MVKFESTYNNLKFVETFRISKFSCKCLASVLWDAKRVLLAHYMIKVTVLQRPAALISGDSYRIQSNRFSVS